MAHVWLQESWIRNRGPDGNKKEVSEIHCRGQRDSTDKRDGVRGFKDDSDFFQ